MIATINRGGIFGVLLTFIVGAIVLIIPFYSTTFYSTIFDIQIPAWTVMTVSLLFLLIQAFWLSSLMNRYQFFEQNTILPVAVFLVVAVVGASSFNDPSVLAFNFLFLWFYQRLFRLDDESMSNFQLYLDVGTLFAVAVLIYPPGSLYFLLILPALNQFAYFGVNRFLALIMSITMVLLPALVIGYLFISPTWAETTISSMVNLEFTFGFLEQPVILFPFIIICIATLICWPILIDQLNSMQNHNRKIVRTIYLHVVVGVLIVLLQGNTSTKAASMSGLIIPFTFLLSFGSGYIKQRWMANIFWFFVLFSLVFVYYVYEIYLG